ncbi:hypothetical protein EON65_23935 [archaeon]|nr:MAG: hypothetical protein EON65_23935 [archaeon]
MWPQCQRCFLLQGSAVRANTHKLVYHSAIKSFYFAPVLALILMQQPAFSEKIKGALDPCIDVMDKAVVTISKIIPPFPKI